MTSCQDLLDKDWQPPPGEPQLEYDPATGWGTILMRTRDRDLVLDLRDDPVCGDLPMYGPLLQRMLEDYEGSSG